MPILYSFRRCPFAIRTRMAIYYSEIGVNLREVSLKNKPQEMLDISPKGTVPVLQTSSFTLEESMEIILWALNKSDTMNLLNPYKKEREKTLAMIDLFDEKFKYSLDRYKYSSKFSNVDINGFKIRHRDNAMQYIKLLEQKLKDCSVYIYEDKLSILDICIFPFVRQYRIADINWFDSLSEIPFTKKWLINILEKKVFKKIMVKYKEWKVTEKSYLFKKDIL